MVFLPDFNVTGGQRVYPAADLSEQISTAGKEASGTGNMKFALNGALTIGTLDGANVEIRDAVGHENFFLFGLTAAEVARAKADGYRPSSHYDPTRSFAKRSTRSIAGRFSHGDREVFRPLVESLLTRDDYMLFADYQSYLDCQQRVSERIEIRTTGLACPFSTPQEPAGSRRIDRSATTAATSGVSVRSCPRKPACEAADGAVERASRFRRRQRPAWRISPGRRRQFQRVLQVCRTPGAAPVRFRRMPTRRAR